MAETSFPVAGGAGVTDATYERLLGPVTGSGRYGMGLTAGQLATPLIFGDNSGRQVKAYAGQAAVVRGFRWESGTTPPVVALDANTSGNPRLDLIVLRLSRNDFTVRLNKINGTPSTVPAAPSPVQDTGSTGVWDLPLAAVRVASSGVTGQPFIQSTDVTPVDWWLTGPGVTLRNGTSIPVTSPGTPAWRLDNGRSYISTGTGYTLLGESGAWTKLTAAGGWTSDALYVQRVNGWTYLQGTLVLNAADKAPSTDLAVCVLPDSFRPAHDMWFQATLQPGQAAFGFITAATGSVAITAYASTFPNGGRAVLGPITYPSAG